MKDLSLTSAISEISLDKDIDKDLIVQTIEKTIVDAAKKKYPQHSNIEAQFDEISDNIRLYYYKTVTKEITDENNEISLSQAREIDPEAQLDDEISYEIEESDYSNIIAQTARQGFFQKISELENSLLIEKYTSQIGKIVHGTVGQVNKNRSVIHLKKNVSAILDPRDAIPFEKLSSGDAVKALLKEIDEKDSKKKFLKLSRTHPDFLMKLLELEIPEVDDKTIEVLAVARDPGKRAKIAVKTNNPDVDPVGSCVGRGGERIQTVVNELNGERIDVVKWSSDLKQFITDSLVPAEIDHIDLDTENNTANVFIDDQNLALAIGKRGQNVRLASKLTQFELNIRTLEDAKSKSEESEDTEDIPEVRLFSKDDPQKGVAETTPKKDETVKDKTAKEVTEKKVAEITLKKEETETIPKKDETAKDETVKEVAETIPEKDETVKEVAETIPEKDETVKEVAETIPKKDETAAETIPAKDETETIPKKDETVKDETAKEVAETIPAKDETVKEVAETIPEKDETEETVAETIPKKDETEETVAETIPKKDETEETVAETIPKKDETAKDKTAKDVAETSKEEISASNETESVTAHSDVAETSPKNHTEDSSIKSGV